MARRFKARIVVTLIVWCAVASAHENVVNRAARLEQEGKFQEAAALLEQALSAATDQRHKKELAFELDRLHRIRLDYSLTNDALFEVLKESVKELTAEEFERWVAEGRFDGRVIDGTFYFVGTSRSNLFFRYPDVRPRRINAPDESAFAQAVLENARAIKAAALDQHTPFVKPTRFRNTMTVTLKAGVVPVGETVRAWLPIPRDFPHQKNVKLLASSSPPLHVAPPESPIRSVYLEQPAQNGRPTEFMIAYSYTAYGVYFNLNPAEVRAADVDDPRLRPYLGEVPHIVFTERIKRLSDEIAGSEANPLLKARAFYNWIAENIQYSYALEYSTIRNISEYCLANKYGDCGQAALLFMTLCRYNGIPARWQSGWFTFPGGKTIHDWTEIYIEPYGWIPVDPYMGVFAMQYLPYVGEDQRRKVRDFYFGGLDQYRMAANSDHNQELSPPKHSLRSDNVDFQRGELEWGPSNIYFNLYSFKLDVEELKSTP